MPSDSAASTPEPASAQPASASAVSAPTTTPGLGGFKAGRVGDDHKSDGVLAGIGMLFWLAEAIFIVAGLVAILYGWSVLGVALIAFGLIGGGLFWVF